MEAKRECNNTFCWNCHNGKCYAESQEEMDETCNNGLLKGEFLDMFLIDYGD